MISTPTPREVADSVTGLAEQLQRDLNGGTDNKLLLVEIRELRQKLATLEHELTGEMRSSDGDAC